MAQCRLCGAEFPDKRKKLGIHICLECGDTLASREILRKKSCVAPAYNKGAYQYVTDIDMAKDVGK